MIKTASLQKYPPKNIPPSIEKLAAEAAFSRFHFQRMFRALTGESVNELVRRVRLERAAYRLRRESVAVIEVALDAGYDSAEAFSRAFRRGCGMSPSRYRTARQAGQETRLSTTRDGPAVRDFFMAAPLL